ncbi:unnamed protein product [Cuscuta campestris]|uniref:Uncharacterized protein n=1 Tax=Cuscuta campestris TaxID=132261 RepID=A0A484MND7_9ASTE|nr:unnamed protein product [Cuscuta campestris]
MSGLDMIPPHNNTAFNMSSSPHGFYSTPMYGVIPTYPHLPSSSILPMHNSMSYGALLQQVMNPMNPGNFSEHVGCTSVQKNLEQK